MPRNFKYNTVSEALPSLMRSLLTAPAVHSRNGLTRERTMVSITIAHPHQRGITAPHRHASLPAQIAETMWVLAGRNDVDWLSHYLPRAPQFSDDGKVWRGGYGPRIRHWNEGRVDQLRHVVGLLREDPDTRRAVINIYDPSIDDQPGKDIPCNNWLHFLPRDGKLHLHVATRSNDLMWGWSGINAFEWSALLEVVAALTGFIMGELHFSISSLHLYDRHFNKAERIMRGNESPKPILFVDPYMSMEKVKWSNDAIDNFDMLVDRWFEIEELIRTRADNARVSIEDFPEPMLRSWLHVLEAWWAGDEEYLRWHLGGTALQKAFLESPQRKVAGGDESPKPSAVDAFKKAVIELHKEKHAAYGDSWKKRGELVSILANVARKVDRIEGGKETSDETQTDTAIDLWVYLLKYHAWLSGQDTEGTESLDRRVLEFAPAERDESFSFQEGLATLIQLAGAELPKAGRRALVAAMAAEAGQMAYARWSEQEWKNGNAARSWKGYGDA